jgi:N4-gp56 family major capsid protein
VTKLIINSWNSFKHEVLKMGHTIEQLTDTTTTSVGSTIPEIWAAQVDEAARAERRCREFVRINTDLLNKPGDIVRIQKRGTLTASSFTEAGTITPGELTYDQLALTPVAIAAGVSVTKEAVNRSHTNVLRDARVELGEALAQKEDVDIITVLAAATTNVVYGGTADGTATLADGDVLTPALFAKAMREIRKSNYNPDVCFIAPEQGYTLGTEDQFTSAATWGNRDYLKKGILGEYLGVTIVQTTNVTSATAPTNYHNCVMMDSRKAGVLALKSNVTVETDYETLERKHIITAALEEKAGLLNDAAVCVIRVTDI